MSTKAQRIRDQLRAACEVAYGEEAIKPATKRGAARERMDPTRAGFLVEIEGELVHVVVFRHEDRPWVK